MNEILAENKKWSTENRIAAGGIAVAAAGTMLFMGTEAEPAGRVGDGRVETSVEILSPDQHEADAQNESRLEDRREVSQMNTFPEGGPTDIPQSVLDAERVASEAIAAELDRYDKGQ